jgi:predicted DNA-binding protein (UPF0251 family)
MRDLKEVALATDEWEAIRLADAEGRYQMEAAKAMGVSRQTFDRIIARARRKIAEALVHGHALRIEAPLVRDSRPSQAGMNAPGETEKRAGFRISGS